MNSYKAPWKWDEYQRQMLDCDGNVVFGDLPYDGMELAKQEPLKKMRLIALAPELLSALEDLLEGFDEQVSESTDDLNKRIRNAENILKALRDE